ncbi:MAG: hypothetical protein HY673_10450 [Chloroflexi bacterium]|nr:hypothetical protein [Chloroflexota bacterium]
MVTGKDAFSPASQKRLRFTLQECTFKLGVQAVTGAAGFDHWITFRPVLEEGLPFNSKETRKRYTSNLRKWALDDGDLACLTTRIWQSYRDTELLVQVLRERYLAAYPVLGRFVVAVLCRISPGDAVDLRMCRDFLSSEGSTITSKTPGRLQDTMRELGFLRKTGPGVTAVNATTLPSTAFLLLVHRYFAPKPTTVSVGDILNHPFWRHLGGRDEAEVRSALSLAAARDVISRYATVDHLEQIATRYSIEDLLRLGERL